MASPLEAVEAHSLRRSLRWQVRGLHRGWLMLRTLSLLLLALWVPLLVAGSSDPGILLELDRENFSLRARDLGQSR